MKIRDIALKNISRRKGKTALIVSGIALGTASLVAILTLVLAFQNGIDAKLASLGYSIVVHPSSSNLSLNFGGMEIAGVDTYETAFLDNRDLAKIRRSSPGSIKAVSPKLLHTTMLKGKQVLFAGTDLAQEMRVKTWWGLNDSRSINSIAKTGTVSPAKIVVGYDVARKLALKKGDELKIRRNSFEVAEVLRQSGSQDDGVVFADIDAVRSIAKSESLESSVNSVVKSGNVKGSVDNVAKGGSLNSRVDDIAKSDSLRGGGAVKTLEYDRNINVIEVALTQNADTNAVVENIRKAVPGASVTSIKQAVQYKEKAVGSLAGFGLAVTAAIILISGFIVFFIMSSSVSDRRREIGIFRAIGYRRSIIANIILMEAFFQSVMAGVAGYLMGIGLSYSLQKAVSVTDFAISINVLVLILSLTLAIAVGMIASLPATLKAVNISPAEAVKEI